MGELPPETLWDPCALPCWSPKKWPNLIKRQMLSCQWKLSDWAVRLGQFVSAPQDGGWQQLHDDCYTATCHGWKHCVFGCTSHSSFAHPCDVSEKVLTEFLEPQYINLLLRGSQRSEVELTVKHFLIIWEYRHYFMAAHRLCRSQSFEL